MCIQFYQTGSVGEGSDHLQLIKFWPGPATGRKFLVLRYCGQHTVFAYLRALFIITKVVTLHRKLLRHFTHLTKKMERRAYGLHCPSVQSVVGSNQEQETLSMS